jgi:uncharacterized protein YjcR
MGAPKGNRNALKHGLYAKHFTPEERAGLQKMKPEDSTHEMYVLQVIINDLFEQHILEREHVKKLREQGRQVDLEALTRLDNSLALAITALNGTKRTHALFKGTDATSNDAYDEALNSLAIFKQEPYLIEAKAEQLVEEVWVEEQEQVE